MRTTNYVAHCQGCRRRLHAPTPEKLNRQALRHARNCAPFLAALAARMVLAPEPESATEPAP